MDIKKIPQKFLENMKELLNEKDYNNLLKCYSLDYTKTLRFNSTKNFDIQQILKDLNISPLNKIPYANAYKIPTETKLGNHPYHHAGLFYIQEASAMLPAISVSYNSNDIVLDMCASPGGKSSQVAEQIPNGILVSNEIITNRALILQENMIRLGFKNNIIISTTPENLTKLGAIFDKVLVDAPCSGEGLFRKEENSILQWYDGINLMNAQRQLKILDYASMLVKPNGKIIYSTCTFSKIENEEVIEKFLSSHTNFKLGKISEDVIQNTTSGLNGVGRRVFPFSSIGEGQFMCVLENCSSESPFIQTTKNNMQKLSQKQLKIVNDWINDNLEIKLENLQCYNETIYYLPNSNINTKNIYTLKYGVILGKIEKDRFIPNHNLFTSFGLNFKHILNLNLQDERVKKYLIGESFEINENIPNGYASICVNSLVLGGIKITQSRANNLYPKHLRIKNANQFVS